MFWRFLVKIYRIRRQKGKNFWLREVQFARMLYHIVLGTSRFKIRDLGFAMLHLKKKLRTYDAICGRNARSLDPSRTNRGIATRICICTWNRAEKKLEVLPWVLRRLVGDKFERNSAINGTRDFSESNAFYSNGSTRTIKYMYGARTVQRKIVVFETAFLSTFEINWK